jgi:hypothetical protein
LLSFCLALSVAALGVEQGVDDALARATATANAALDAAYAKSAKRPHAVAPPHQGPWVTAAEAQKSSDGERGYTLSWRHSVPAGFEFEVVVKVSARGEPRVLRASALFAPD